MTPLPSHETAILRPEGYEQSQGHWTVWVTTGSQGDQDTQTDVAMVMCGTELTSQPTELTGQNGQDTALRPGSQQQFKVSRSR